MLRMRVLGVPKTSGDPALNVARTGAALATIALARLLDLDDARPEPRKQQRGVRACQCARQIDDGQAVQWSHVASTPITARIVSIA